MPTLDPELRAIYEEQLEHIMAQLDDEDDGTSACIERREQLKRALEPYGCRALTYHGGGASAFVQYDHRDMHILVNLLSNVKAGSDQFLLEVRHIGHGQLYKRTFGGGELDKAAQEFHECVLKICHGNITYYITPELNLATNSFGNTQ